MSRSPQSWRSVLPHLGYALPPDLTAHSDGGPVMAGVPLELARQSMSSREYWEIPEPVLEQYRRYRPSPLWRAHGFEAEVGARVPIYVKYEGANISGSHKLNTALAQAYYYRRAGYRELVTGTGAGQWGTALAAACAAFGMSCTVFMVGRSLRDKPYRGSLMRLYGAAVHASPSALTEIGGTTRQANSLALAIGEAVEYAAAGPSRAFCIGSGETYSILHQSVIGLESIAQLAEAEAQVDTVIGCFGAGSNFGGIALPFFAAQRAGEAGGEAALIAVESSATPKLTRGVYAYDHTDATGSGPLEAMYTIGADYAIPPSHSAGLRFHGAAKLLSAMRRRDEIAALAVGQREALLAGRTFALSEMMLPAPESGHALAAAASIASRRAAEHRSSSGILVCVSGHGLLDLGAYDQLLAGQAEDEPAGERALDAATALLRPVDHELVG